MRNLSFKIVPIIADFALLVNVFFVPDSDNELLDAWRGTGPRPTMKEKRVQPTHRSAGACPPRGLLQRKASAAPSYGWFLSLWMHGEGQALALR